MGGKLGVNINRQSRLNKWRKEVNSMAALALFLLIRANGITPRSFFDWLSIHFLLRIKIICSHAMGPPHHALQCLMIYPFRAVFFSHFPIPTTPNTLHSHPSPQQTRTSRADLFNEKFSLR